MGKTFSHLHLHTVHSLLDGFTKMPDLVQVVKEHGQDSVAVTDHGNMSGIPSLFKEAKDAGVKPIAGLEAYICEDATVRGGGKDEKRPYYHITLLARNAKGYRNLCKLSTLSWTEGFYSKPRLDPAMCAMYAEDVICLTGCIGGWPAAQYLAGDGVGARETLGLLRSVFERVYGELTYTGEPDQRKWNRFLIETARRDDLPLVVTGDSHYTWEQQHDDHDTLFAMGLHKKKDDVERLRFLPRQYHVKSSQEIYSLGLPEDAVARSQRIADDCEKYELPRAGGIPHAPGADDRLFLLALEGLEKRVPDFWAHPGDAYMSRLQKEIQTIKELNYESYFFVAHDVCRFVRERGLTTGWGRGSSAGSLVSFCLFITHIDPVLHNLYFERFLNAARREPPDIDLDFSDTDRALVVDFVKEKYGEDHVSNIATYGTLGPRQVIIDSAKAFGKTEESIKLALEAVPHDPTWKVKDVLESEGIMETIKTVLGKEVCHAMDAFQEIPRSASVHAAGFLIDSAPLADNLPFMQTKTGGTACQYDYDSLRLLGFEKFDLLGVRTLRVVADCARMVGVDPYRIPLDDRATYHLLSVADTIGVFQLEGWGYQQFLRKFKPRNFNDVMLLNALYRPGPMQGGKGLDEFVARRHNKAEVRYLHHSVVDILRPTYGVMVYQEQVMGVVRTLASWPLEKCDELRWAIGKKKKEKVQAFRKEFIESCKRCGHSQRFAEDAFQQIEYFARYGWNKAHAAAYGMVTYATAYLKANFRKEYMTCLLNTEIGNHEKIAKILRDINRSGLRLYSPHVNRSQVGFVAHDGGILSGLALPKGVGEKAASAIVEERKRSGAFTSYADFELRIPRKVVNSRVKEILKRYEAFNGLPESSDSDHLF